MGLKRRLRPRLRPRLMAMKKRSQRMKKLTWNQWLSKLPTRMEVSRRNRLLPFPPPPPPSFRRHHCWRRREE